MNIFDLAAEYQRLLDLLTDADDPELEESIAAALADNIDAIEVKAQGWALVLRSLDAEETAVHVEVRRLGDRARTLANRQERMKLALRDALTLGGIDKVRGSLVTVSLGAASQRVEVVDPSSLPAEFWRPPAEPEPDKAALLKALKAGPVPGAEIVLGARSLTIR